LNHPHICHLYDVGFLTQSTAGAGYDVTRDGRFLMLNWVTDTPSPLTLVMNWDAEYKK